MKRIEKKEKSFPEGYVRMDLMRTSFDNIKKMIRYKIRNQMVQYDVLDIVEKEQEKLRMELIKNGF